MSRKEQCCGLCRFWQYGDWEAGFCRRYPPVLNPFHVALPDDGETLTALAMAEATDSPFCWSVPRTSSDEWCGEFQPREKD